MINNSNIIPLVSYEYPDIQKKEIYKENKYKTGIYLWTNKISGVCYVGSAVNLSRRFKDYFNKSYLIMEVKKNNSLIYRALLKYGYSRFRLDILEYCDIKFVIKREQFYLDSLDLKYNILKVAGSLLGFKHNILSKEKIRIAKLGKPRSEMTKLKLSANSIAIALSVKNIRTGEICLFPSIRRTACFININNTYLAKCLKKNNFYKGRGYYITKINK